MIRPFLWITSLICIVMTLKLFYTSLNGSQFNASNPVLQQCGDNVDVNEMIGRINLVKKYINDERGWPRETIVIVGIPGGMSEIPGNIISLGNGNFYLPNVLNRLAYYMKYEPTVGFPLATALIEDIFRCNFEEKELLVHNLMQNETRLLTQTLLAAPECVSKEEDRTTLTSNICAKVFSAWLNEKCHQSDLVFAHTVQIKSIFSLNVLMTGSKSRSFSVRVLHVVRDPRAIVHDVSKSVDKQLTAEELGVASYRICAQMMLNLKAGEDSPPWLRGRYYLIKIEEFLNSPKQYLSKLKEFLKNGNLKFGNSSDLETLIDGRNCHGWRSEMSRENVRLVEEKCKKVIAFLGYN